MPTNQIKPQDLTIGVEIEMTGITREQAANIAAAVLGGQAEYEGGYYDKYVAIAPSGRKWTFMSDSSIDDEGRGRDYQTEMTTPILYWDDLPKLQEIVKALKACGAHTNDSTGIHVHIGADRFRTGRQLINLVHIMQAHEDTMYRAVGTSERRARRWCKKVARVFSARLDYDMTIDQVLDVWYTTLGEGEDRGMHYNPSRYHGLNLHAYKTRGTVEFRIFNGTMHAGKIKTYAQLCACIVASALNAKRASSVSNATGNEKYAFRCWLLKLGMIGDEFKTARQHLLANLDGDSGWRTEAQREQQNAELRSRNAA